ncbi:Uu.00g142300.m01.CDS01 [Anthostomella pinea]|uniref:Uu.00g142300.m01.CDS01 n=1 Tax=Anthostomella pinea TaxID=933095 RepID=A0AAI8VR38_9PEZI|nr:Uu.00g142300.m01.CDS01 [Anthostomella pinea]
MGGADTPLAYGTGPTGLRKDDNIEPVPYMDWAPKSHLDLHAKHGDFVRIAPNGVSITHPAAIKSLILTPQYKGHFYNIMKFPDWRTPLPLSILDPKAKAEMNRRLASAYPMSNVIKSEEQISRLVEKLTGWMDQHASTHEPMDLAKFLTFTAFDVVGEVVFSRPFGFLEQGVDIGDSISQTMKFEGYISVAAFAQWLHNSLVANPFITWLDIMPTNYLSKTSNKALEEHKANQDARFDYVAHWLKTHEEHPERLSYRDVQAAVMANVGAGSDTVSCALQSFIYHAIRHPNAWSRMRQEIDEARSKEGACTDRVVTYADAQKLPYLQACIKEALRIFHPVPMGTARVVPKQGIVIGGRALPAGTTVSLNTFSMNLSTDVWGADAKEFKPERWLKEDSAQLEKPFIPFSGGIGACVGQHLARIELSKILATIVRDFNIRQVDPKQKWSYHAYFTTVPGGWPVYVEKREAA